MAKCKATAFTASGQVVVGSEGVYHGFTVTVVTAVGAINIRKASVTGQIIDVIPSATAVGSRFYYQDGISCESGLFVEFNGGATGTVNVLYEA